MKKTLLKERFQQLAGIKPLYELDEIQFGQKARGALDKAIGWVKNLSPSADGEEVKQALEKLGISTSGYTAYDTIASSDQGPEYKISTANIEDPQMKVKLNQHQIDTAGDEQIFRAATTNWNFSDNVPKLEVKEYHLNFETGKYDFIKEKKETVDPAGLAKAEDVDMESYKDSIEKPTSISIEDLKTRLGGKYKGSIKEMQIQMLNEKWVLRPWVKQVITIGKGIGNIISAWGWCCGSDSRLKKNIRLVGKSPSGIPIYEFEYKNKARYGGGTYRGVLAEETPSHAVTLNESGYKYVNYNKIDVSFAKIKPSASRLLENVKNILQEASYDKNPIPGSTPMPTFPDPMAPGREEMETDPRGGGMGMENERRLMALQTELAGYLPAMGEMVTDMTSTIPNDREAVAKTGWTQEFANLAIELSNLITTAHDELAMTGKITQETYTAAVAAKKWWIKLLHFFRGLVMVEVPD